MERAFNSGVLTSRPRLAGASLLTSRGIEARAWALIEILTDVRIALTRPNYSPLTSHRYPGGTDE